MLRIAKLTDYATCLMARLALEPGRCLSAQQLAGELNLPAPTVAKLMKRLAHAGLVLSQRGVGGGYGLARAPEAISVAAVVVAIEGPLALTECALGVGRCSLETGCATRANWQLISQAVRVALEAVSLADMAAPMARTVQFPALHKHDLRKG